MLVRAIFLLLFLLLGSFPFASRAQQAGSQGQQVVTLPQKSGTLASFLQALEAETHIPFSFSNEALALEKKVTLTGQEKTLDEVLTTLFKGTNITWLYRPDQILLFEKTDETSGRNKLSKNSRFTVSGYVREAGSAEPLIGVTIHAPAYKAGITTNNFGFYSLTLPSDSVSLQFSYVGYQPVKQHFVLQKDLELNVQMASSNQLREVQIIADKERRSTQTAQTSQVEVPVEQVKNIPALLGEKDVMKVVQLMPGVMEGNEGSSGLYVRGGGPDQNLIILDDATVYNTSHLFGLFSVFNGDALKNIDVTKGGFPARYGGRLSSVLEMTMKEGNKEAFHGEGGIGLVSSRLLLEGPLKKQKASFLVSVRRTYLDAMLQAIMPSDMDLGYYFLDTNVKLNYDFGQKDKLYLSGYFGHDKFYLDTKERNSKEQIQFFWGNATATARWNHLINEKLFANTSLIFSQYRFVVGQENEYADYQSNFRFFSGIRDYSLKTDLDYYPTPAHYLKFGGLVTYHYFTPNAVRALDSSTDFKMDSNLSMGSMESAVYVEDFFSPVPKLLLNTGLRLTHFTSGSRHFFNPEPRLAASYQFSRTAALKASFATMNQYIHLLSSTGTGFPIDLWLPATNKVKPQRSQQVALGFAKDLFSKKVNLEVEAYYKKLNQIITYNENANFLTIANPDALAPQKLDWEDNVTAGQGWAYGLEFLLQKKVGRFTGWLGYTISKTEHQFDSLNGGRKFYARYDRRHDISVTAAYKFTKNFMVSANWVYGTGNAISLPTAEYYVPLHSQINNSLTANYQVAEYGDRNNFRVPAYHRLDVGMQFRKQLRWAERTWDLSVYNAYNRRNPFFYNLEFKNDKRILRMTSLFPLIPSVSYNLKF